MKTTTQTTARQLAAVAWAKTPLIRQKNLRIDAIKAALDPMLVADLRDLIVQIDNINLRIKQIDQNSDTNRGHDGKN